MKISVFTDDKSLVHNTWWSNFRNVYPTVTHRVSVLAELNITISLTLGGLCLDGDEKDIFDFLMRWS